MDSHLGLEHAADEPVPATFGCGDAGPILGAHSRPTGEHECRKCGIVLEVVLISC